MLIFYEDTHDYIWNKEESYESMTSFISSFEPSTDWNKIAERYADKHGNTAQYWLDRWEYSRNGSARLGSYIHEIKEHQAFKEPNCFPNPVVNNEKKAFSLENLSDGLYPELIVYDHDFKLAGQADRVEKRNGLIHIKDYKTSEKIEQEPKIFFDKERKKKIRKRLLPPVSHLDNNNYTKYALQLSGYAYILERWGYKVGTLEIIHIIFERSYDEYGKTSADFYDSRPAIQEEVIYQVPYYRKEVQMMFHKKKMLEEIL